MVVLGVSYVEPEVLVSSSGNLQMGTLVERPTKARSWLVLGIDHWWHRTSAI